MRLPNKSDHCFWSFLAWVRLLGTLIDAKNKESKHLWQRIGRSVLFLLLRIPCVESESPAWRSFVTEQLKQSRSKWSRSFFVAARGIWGQANNGLNFPHREPHTCFCFRAYRKYTHVDRFAWHGHSNGLQNICRFSWSGRDQKKPNKKATNRDNSGGTINISTAQFK